MSKGQGKGLCRLPEKGEYGGMKKDKQQKYELRKGVLFSGLAIFGITALAGILDNQALVRGTGTLFSCFRLCA